MIKKMTKMIKNDQKIISLNFAKNNKATAYHFKRSLAAKNGTVVIC